MVFDERSDEEPDDPEFDIDSRAEPPEFDVRSGDDLVPEGPEDISTDPSDAPAQVKATFWLVLLLVDGAMFGLIVGPAAIYLTDMAQFGYLLTAFGAFCAIAAYRRYREFERTPDEELGIADGTAEEPSGSETATDTDEEDRSA